MTDEGKAGRPDLGTDPLEVRARRRLKQKRDFAGHVLVYTMVNGFLIIIWAFTSAGFFWPIFPLLGWGIGLVMNAWDVWRNDDFSEAEISREMSRLKQHDTR
ncbi:MAG TPA: 2TM domain-containing protein [Jatrophihabitans sp.]|jgi:hypothetical protein